MKKRILCCLLALCTLGITTSCTIDDSDDLLIPTYSTGDEGDDPPPPPPPPTKGD